MLKYFFLVLFFVLGAIMNDEMVGGALDLEL